MDTHLIQILFPRNVNQSFTYHIKGPLPSIGSYVLAPLGREKSIGAVWSTHTDDIHPDKLKSITEIYPITPLSPTTHRFIDWVSSYYMAPLGKVLKMAMPIEEAISWSGTTRHAYPTTASKPFKMTPARQTLVDYLSQHPGCTTQRLLAATQASPAILRGLVEAGAVQLVDQPQTVPQPALLSYTAVTLSEDQQKAASILKNQLTQQEFHVNLLDGVTGSGKTEVYFDAIAHALKFQQQCLILMPEIALTTQWLSRFESRFGAPPTLWHSSLSPKTRRENWRNIVEGHARVIVGARSALMLPYAKLGLIIIDEEHDPSYKQDEGIHYHARDAAIMRGKLENCPVVLASATPSLETWQHIHAGRYTHLTLPDRHGGASMPDIHLIDMTKSRPDKGGFISAALKKAITETLSRQEQVLLFLNRRGFAPLTLCTGCGHRMLCIQCSASLVFHTKKRMLVCHHCGFGQPWTPDCPSCAGTNTMITYGPGIERIEEEVRHLFPHARIGLMSSDHQPQWRDTQDLIHAIEKREIDILIGTQMATKGHHFKYLTLVGVIDADSGLGGGDPRAAERCYHLLHQVSGRAGREHLKGQVLIQTYNPTHALMKALATGDRETFMNVEMTTRDEWSLPPFGRYAALILSGKDLGEVNQASTHLAQLAPLIDGVTVLGPVQAPLSFLRGQYRFRLLLKMTKQQSLQKYLTHWLEGVKLGSKTKLDIDIDPHNFL